MREKEREREGKRERVPAKLREENEEANKNEFY